MATVNTWATTSPDFTPAAKPEFSSIADSALIVHALTGGHTVVTHERPRNTRKHIQIPIATAALDVAYASPWRMLREERPLFVLAAAPQQKR